MSFVSSLSSPNADSLPLPAPNQPNNIATPSCDPLYPSLLPLRSFYSYCDSSSIPGFSVSSVPTAFPAFSSVSAASLPEPFNILLSHSHNMTPTLSHYFHDSPIHLRVFHKLHDPQRNILLRWVALEVDTPIHHSANPDDPTAARSVVEFGSILIHLSSLSPPVQSLVLQGQIPFGTILIQNQVQQICQPVGFFNIQKDQILTQTLQLDHEVTNDQPFNPIANTKSLDSHSKLNVHSSDSLSSAALTDSLYGRCNEIYTPDHQLIAQVVEILPSYKQIQRIKQLLQIDCQSQSSAKPSN